MNLSLYFRHHPDQGTVFSRLCVLGRQSGGGCWGRVGCYSLQRLGCGPKLRLSQAIWSPDLQLTVHAGTTRLVVEAPVGPQVEWRGCQPLTLSVALPCTPVDSSLPLTGLQLDTNAGSDFLTLVPPVAWQTETDGVDSGSARVDHCSRLPGMTQACRLLLGGRA